MADLIDRTALANRMQFLIRTHQRDAFDALNEIDNAPAVDAVVLPCKVGDTVYSKDGKAAEVEGFYIDKRSIGVEVTFECDYSCKYCAFNSWHTEYSGESSCDGEYGVSMVDIGQFSKNVFLSREEAEAALNGERREDNGIYGISHLRPLRKDT